MQCELLQLAVVRRALLLLATAGCGALLRGPGCLLLRGAAACCRVGLLQAAATGCGVLLRARDTAPPPLQEKRLAGRNLQHFHLVFSTFYVLISTFYLYSFNILKDKY